MNRILNNFCLPIAILVLIFFNINPAHASQIVDQSNYSSAVGTTASASIAATFLPAVDNISQIQLSLFVNTLLETHGHLYICRGTSGGADCTGAVLIATKDFTLPAAGDHGAYYINHIGYESGEFTIFDLNSLVGITSGTSYYWGFVIDGGYTITTAGVGLGLTYAKIIFPTGFESYTPVYATYYDDTYISAPTTNFWFDYPVAGGGSIYVGMPAEINYHYTNPFYPLFNQVNFLIQRQPDINGLGGLSLPTIRSPIGAAIYTPIYATSTINLPNGNYETQVRFTFAGSAFQSGILATTSFSVASSTNISIPLFFEIPDDICAGIATSTGITDLHIFGDIECGLRKLSIWAFTAHQASTDNLNIAYENFKKSFPFSAFFGLTDAISGSIGSTTPNTTSGALKMPFINTSGHYIMIDVLSSSSMPNLIGQTNTTLFRNSLSWILWLLVAFLIFLQFKKI